MKKALAGLLSVALVVGVSVMASESAHAAGGDGVDPNTIRIQRDGGGPNDPLRPGDTVLVTAKWSVPDSTQPGHTFTMTLPSVFSGAEIPDFDLRNVQDGDPVGRCSVAGSPAVVTCILGPNISNKVNVSGDLWLRVQATQQTNDTSVLFVVDGVGIYIGLPGGTGIVPDDRPIEINPDGLFFKSGHSLIGDAAGYLYWEVGIPYHTPSAPVVFRDTIQAGASSHQHLLPNEQGPPGYRTPQRLVRICAGSTETVPTGEYTVEVNVAQSELTITIQPAAFQRGCDIRVVYLTRPNNPLVGGQIFRNQVQWNNQYRDSSVTIAGTGGGTGGGDRQLGSFSIRKTLAGNAASRVPGTQEFTVPFLADGQPGGDLKIRADGTPVTVPNLPFGTVVTLGEIQPPDSAGLDWQIPQIRVNQAVQGTRAEIATITSDTVVDVVVENTVTSVDTSFSVEKVLSGNAAGSVPGSRRFNFNYSYQYPGETTWFSPIQLISQWDPPEHSPIQWGRVSGCGRCPPPRLLACSGGMQRSPSTASRVFAIRATMQTPLSSCWMVRAWWR